MNGDEFVSLNTAEKVSQFDQKLNKRLLKDKSWTKKEVDEFIERGLSIIDSEDESLCSMDNLAIKYLLNMVEFLYHLKRNIFKK